MHGGGADLVGKHTRFGNEGIASNPAWKAREAQSVELPYVG